MIHIKKLSSLFIGTLIFTITAGQQIPSKPASYPIFSPLLLNPAIAGSRDFSRVELISRVNASKGAQMLSYHKRLRKGNTIGSPRGINDFSNMGWGGYLFHDRLESSRNLGAGVSAAYHVPLGPEKVSGLSFGVSARALYIMGNNDTETTGPAVNSIYPNGDVGIYYYGTRGFLGLSSVNILSLMADSVPTINELWVPNEHLLHAAYKLVLSRKNAILLEPAVIIHLSDSLFNDIESNFTSYLKLYVQNASFGAYFENLDELGFFMQYQFPAFYAGIYAAFPQNEMLINNDQLTIEISLGLNLGKSNRSKIHPYMW